MNLGEHVDHGPWMQVGKCVYCECGDRLYQGRVPRTVEEQRDVAAALEELASLVRRAAEGGPRT